MIRTFRAGVFAAVIGSMLLSASVLRAEPAPTLAEVKTEAIKAVRSGHFDQTNDLLNKAAATSHDATVEKMAGWSSNFEKQRIEFAGERHEQYKKLLGNVELLISKHHPDYAMDVASRAYPLADSKTQFRQEPNIDELVKSEIHLSEQYDKDEQWIRSLRIYTDLGILEPSIPLWKDRLKLATRRVRLLGLYAPESLKTLQDGDQKEREEVDAILRAANGSTTQPAAPATQPAAEKDKDKDKDAEAYKIDWRDTLRNIRLEMLWDALNDAKQNYYREVTFRQLALGGLGGLQAVVSTRGLEKAFPGLSDPVKKAAFVQMLDDEVAANMKAADDNEARRVLRSTLMKIKSVNNDTVKVPDEVLISEFADGAFAQCDPFTNMIWPSDVEEFNKQTQGEFSGVGIQIQSDENGNLKVISPLEDTPAYKAKIKPDDIITHINGKSAKNINLSQAVRTITGPSGTIVTLTIKSPDGKVRELPIRRETIHVASLKGWLHKPGGGWDFMIDAESKIAYMRLTNFTKDSPRELDKAIERIKELGGKGLIFDLRYNPGGLLTSATEIADKFLKEGVIVSTHPDRDTGNPPTVAVAKPDDNDTDLPLIVLVNQYSASASEIVSGALKDHKRALIVGERTFGKGSVQMLFPLADRSAYLKLTTSHYYLPLGRCIHREENSEDWGVAPDVTVEMTPEQMRAAIDARQEQDILRDVDQPEQPKADNPEPKGDEKKKPKRGLLLSDPQLGAALLMLKLQIAAG